MYDRWWCPTCDRVVHPVPGKMSMGMWLFMFGLSVGTCGLALIPFIIMQVSARREMHCPACGAKVMVCPEVVGG